MSLTVQDAEAALVRAQLESNTKHAGEFWDEYPQYRHGKTRDEAIEDVTEQLDTIDDVEWDDVPQGEFAGHTIKVVEDFGGEGRGDTRYVVIQIDEQFFRMDGYYASYDGSSWDGPFREVTPAQRTITVYE